MTLNETRTAIKQAKTGTAPGQDGLPPAFYKFLLKHKHKHSILGKLTTYFNSLTTQSVSEIKIIHKKNDKQILNNYRPISLLNIDYKIYTKIITNRLHPLTNTLISPTQNACREHASILDATSNIRILCEMKSNTTVIFIDYKKAFDRISHKYLIKLLKRMNFGPNMIQRIQNIYTDALATIIINNNLSRYIDYKGGVRQGCPLSALLYALVLQSLTDYVNRNIHTQRITNEQLRIHETIILRR